MNNSVIAEDTPKLRTSTIQLFKLFFFNNYDVDGVTKAYYKLSHKNSVISVTELKRTINLIGKYVDVLFSPFMPSMSLDDFIYFSCMICTASFHTLAILCLSLVPDSVVDKIEFNHVKMMILILGSEFSPDMAYLNYHLERTAKMKDFLLQEDFLTFSDNYSYLFKPIVEFQSRFRNITLGKTTWMDIRKRQKSIKDIIAFRELNNGKYPPCSTSNCYCHCCYCFVELYRRIFRLPNPMEYEYEMPPELAKCQYKTAIKVFYGKYNTYFKKNQRQVDLKARELNAPPPNLTTEYNTYNTNTTKSTSSISSKQKINSLSSGKFISPPMVTHTSFPSTSKSLTILNNTPNIDKVNNHQHYHSCTNIANIHNSLLVRNIEQKKEKLHSDTTQEQSSNTHGPSCSITDGTPTSNILV